jgi:octanoyl-[GcvH]:protein N-octanoyltransferase
VRLLDSALPAGDDDAAMEMAVAHAVLRQASRGEIDAALRVHPARGNVVAFGRRDTNRPRFVDAVAACRSAGFAPVVRAAGGRAVAHTSEALVIDHVSHDPLSPGGMEERFVEYGELFAAVFREMGIDARVGEVPGEYCPGAHSINARGTVKLVGTAQRMVRNAWLFSAVVVVDGAAQLRPLLGRVYDALELPFEPASVGAVRDEVDITLDEVHRAVLDAYSSRFALEPGHLDDAVLAEARSMVGDHRVAGR